jgi:hypothetical protein
MSVVNQMSDETSAWFQGPLTSSCAELNILHVDLAMKSFLLLSTC